MADGAAKQAPWALSGEENPLIWFINTVLEKASSVKTNRVIKNYIELISLNQYQFSLK